MALRVVNVQETPNPDAKKFVIDTPAFEATMSFFSAEAAQGHPLASQLFEIRGVTSVLLLADFVTINKSSSASWADISKAVKRVLAAAK